MAVLPLVGRARLDTTCLVIGAMSPDFEYFVHGQLKGEFGHTWPGVALWCVPVTLVSAVVFHRLVKWPLVAVAPRWIGERVAPYALRPWLVHWRALVACVISAALGAATHLLWDGGTHAAHWGEHYFPKIMDHMVNAPVIGRIPVFRVLQHISTGIGLVVVTVYIAVVLRRSPTRAIPPPRRIARTIYLACVAVGIALLSYRALVWLHTGDPGSVVAASISGLLASTLVAALALRGDGARARDQLIE